MTLEINKEIAYFRYLTQLMPRARYSVRQICDDALLVAPNGFGSARLAGKQIGLTFLGLIHGNEHAGVAVLNNLLEHVVNGTVQLRFPVAFALGNTNAGRLNQRFVERDLNRSFGRETALLAEEKRADELEILLKETAILIDFHQTREPTPQPFFIFPYSKNSYKLARSIAPQYPVVTHWGKPFSAEGQCTDEFVNANGGTGITLELGQNSLNPYHVAAGVDAAMWSLRVASEWFGIEPAADSKRSERGVGNLYTWAAVLSWPPQGDILLEPGLTNFTQVKHGQVLGRGPSGPVISPVDGAILFPKYLDPIKDKGLPRPTELCRIMKTINDADLPG